MKTGKLKISTSKPKLKSTAKMQGPSTISIVHQIPSNQMFDKQYDQSFDGHSSHERQVVLTKKQIVKNN